MVRASGNAFFNSLGVPGSTCVFLLSAEEKEDLPRHLRGGCFIVTRRTSTGSALLCAAAQTWSPDAFVSKPVKITRARLGHARIRRDSISHIFFGNKIASSCSYHSCTFSPLPAASGASYSVRGRVESDEEITAHVPFPHLLILVS